jgi:hypothetical protein
LPTFGVSQPPPRPARMPGDGTNRGSAGLSRRMVRRFSCLAVFALAAAACGGAQTAAPEMQPDCAALLVWNGVTYRGVDVGRPLALGRRLGTALIPACGEKEREVPVAAIDGIHPSIALVAPGRKDTYPDSTLVWLGPGYLTTSPLHPLHEEIRAAWGDSNAESGFRCESPRVFRARARERPAASEGFLHVTVDDESLQAFLTREDVDGIVTLDTNTTIVGFRRHGVPFIDAGDEFELTVRECEGREDEPGLAGLRRLMVKRLRP